MTGALAQAAQPLTAAAPAAVPPLLEIAGLSVAYGRTAAVRGLDLSVAAGQSYGLIGESGCGKSTVAYAIMGDLGETGRVTAGRVVVAGRDIARLTARELRRHRGGTAAMVYQDPASALNPSMTIGRQLVEAVRAHRPASVAEARGEAADMLGRVRLKRPAETLERYPHQLSGGELQRVVIAMALLARPALLVLDEPTTGLDVTVEAEVVDLIAGLSESFGTALLYISHNLALIGRVCDRIGVMYAGELVEEGAAERVLTAPEHPYTRGLLACLPRIDEPPAGRRLPTIPGQVAGAGRAPGCSFAPRCPHAVPGRCDVPPGPALLPYAESAVRCLRVGELGPTEGGSAAEALTGQAGPVRVALDRVEKRFERRGLFGTRLARRRRRVVRAVDGVSLDVRAREIVALVGESGSGKSTIAKLLVGLDTVTAGRIALDGAEIGRIPARHRAAAQLRAMQIVFQNPDATLNPAHTVGRTLRRAVERLTGLGGREAARRTGELLAMVRLPPDALQRLPEALSGGQRQRVAIARAMAGDPEVLVADEPVSALDVSVQAAIVNLLVDLEERSGTAILLISHDLALVRHVADRVFVLYRGRMMAEGPAAAIFAPPLHPYVAALLAAAPRIGDGRTRAPVPAAGAEGTESAAGCPFFQRCPHAIPGTCDVERPTRRALASGHALWCHAPLAALAGAPGP